MKIKKRSTQPGRPLIAVESDDGIEALSEWRGLPTELLAEFGVRVDDHPTHPVVFPYPNLSGVWYERRRTWRDDTRPNKYMSPKGSSPHLYNPLHLGPNAGQVWFCEGEFDTLALIYYGLPAVGVAGTNAFNRRWLHLFDDATIVVAFDGDPAGVEAGSKLVDAFRSRRTRAFLFPTPDGYDMNELHKGGELTGLIDAFAEEEGVKVDREVHIEDQQS